MSDLSFNWFWLLEFKLEKMNELPIMGHKCKQVRVSGINFISCALICYQTNVCEEGHALVFCQFKNI